jgi:NACalpha-BTF3-like transcription factor
MCGCNKKNNVDLPNKSYMNVKIYLDMAKYEVKEKWLNKDICTHFNNGDISLVIAWDNASQEDLAKAYEEFNGGETFINKINNSSEKKISKAKKSSKDKGKDKDVN